MFLTRLSWGAFFADLLGTKDATSGNSRYLYFLSEVDKLKPSYVTLVRYSTMLDPGHRGTDHDVVGSYGSLLKNTKVVINAGVTPEEGAGLVAEGKTDAVSFGTLFISSGFGAESQAREISP